MIIKANTGFFMSLLIAFFLSLPLSIAIADCLDGYIAQASYEGDCKDRPPGTICLGFSDGYVWLVRVKSITGGGSGGICHGNEVRISYGAVVDPDFDAEYYHILNTDYIKTMIYPAVIKYSPKYPKVNEVVTFEGPDGTRIVKYSWYFYPGSSEAYGKIITRAFDTAGDYNILLKVDYENGSYRLIQDFISVVGDICEPRKANGVEINIPPPGWPGEVLWSQTASSGETLQIIWTGSYYEFYYIGNVSGTSGPIGVCIFNHGLNKAWYWAVDKDGDGPDYFTRTQWLNVDGGWDDESHGIPGYLDIIQHTVDICNHKYSQIYELKVYPDDCEIDGRPAISNPHGDYLILMDHCKPKDFARHNIEYIDPPLGSETELLLNELIQQIQLGEILDMGEWNINSCDINGDGTCDALDYTNISNSNGICWESSDYWIFADRDGDGCITESDQEYLFCPGDFAVDNDVDGMDLSNLILNPMAINLEKFAKNFGRTDCPSAE